MKSEGVGFEREWREKWKGEETVIDREGVWIGNRFERSRDGKERGWRKGD